MILLDSGHAFRMRGEKLCLNRHHLTTASGARRPSTAKLTARKVRNIRALWASDDRPTQTEIARRYGVTRSAISLVVNEKPWAL